MRKLLSIIFLISSVSCFADEGCTPFAEDSVFVYEGKSADQLYSDLKFFVAKSFATKEVIQLDDAASHRLVVKGSIDFPVNNMTWRELTGAIHFTMELQAKDGRFRVKLYDFEHQSFNTQYKSWTMGTIYVEENPSCIKGLAKKQYKAMASRAIPKIIDTIAMVYAELGNLSAIGIQEDEDEW